MKFKVYYMKPGWFREGIMGARPDLNDLEKTHIHVRDLEGPSIVSNTNELERIYRIMQAEVWSPNGEARELIESLGLRHTSMSVGDVVVVEGGGPELKAGTYMVAGMGFTRLEPEGVDNI